MVERSEVLYLLQNLIASSLYASALSQCECVYLGVLCLL